MTSAASRLLREVRDISSQQIPVVFGEPEDVTYGLDVGDVNGDGYPDVAVAVSDGPNRIYLNLPEKPERRRERSPR